MKLISKCNNCGKPSNWIDKSFWKEDTGVTTKLLEGSIYGYVAWQEADNKTGTETFFCLPHGAERGWSTKQFNSMEELGHYIGENKLKTY